jgi:hypothetical protein
MLFPIDFCHRQIAFVPCGMSRAAAALFKPVARLSRLKERKKEKMMSHVSIVSFSSFVTSRTSWTTNEFLLPCPFAA